MIYLITNRKLVKAFTDSRRLGLGLGKQLAFMKAEHTLPDLEWDPDNDPFFLENVDPRIQWKLSEYADAGAMCGEILAGLAEGLGEYKKPWVVFVHGNNQDGLKNLDKCRELARQHDVNVLAFSWPSRPSEATSLMLRTLHASLGPKGWKTLFSTPIDAWSTALGGPAKLGANMLLQWARLKKSDYDQARKNAEKTAAPLLEALGLIVRELIEPVRALDSSVKFTLLVHSLGNYLFSRIDYAAAAGLGKPFENIILHQADVDHEGHRPWVKDEVPVLGKRVYVSANYSDAVLAASYAANSLSAAKRKKRLGQVMPEPGQVAGNAFYIDMSDGLNLNGVHNFFNLPARNNEAVHKLFGRLLRGQKALPGADLGFELAGGKVYRVVQKESLEDLIG